MLFRLRLIGVPLDWKTVLLHRKFGPVFKRFALVKLGIHEVPFRVRFRDDICEDCIGVSKDLLDFYLVDDGNYTVVRLLEELSVADEVHVVPVDRPIMRDEIATISKALDGLPFRNNDFYMVGSIGLLIRIVGDSQFFLVETKRTRIHIDKVEDLPLSMCKQELFVTRIALSSLKNRLSSLELSLRNALEQAFNIGIKVGKGEISREQADEMLKELLVSLGESG